ncbi:MAG: ABC transporter ATP-binding protein [Bdellovibrionales bacterium]|nr:ABC transporter ATP-binding protein [Bdellovibrionales bacterium]
MQNVVEIEGVNKIYEGGFQALHDVNLNIRKGEIFALLGPNGAGKTTLIGSICGITDATSGSIRICGHDNRKEFRKARAKLGLVPQELTTNAFESVNATVKFSRGVFGKPANQELIDQILTDLSLIDKKNNPMMTLSGGMKRRVMIAKALSHEPEVLFLDEPTAGVDVELRKDMWRLVHKLRENGVTIILTTHYIEEAEEMADRVGVITGGKLLVVEEKQALMQKMGKKQMILTLERDLDEIPERLKKYNLEQRGCELIFNYDVKDNSKGVQELVRDLNEANIQFHDLSTKQSSLEEIFVEMVKGS